MKEQVGRWAHKKGKFCMWFVLNAAKIGLE